MIKVTYENEESGQTMTATWKEGDTPNTVEMTIEFDPEITDEINDPFGVMSKFYEVCSN